MLNASSITSATEHRQQEPADSFALTSDPAQLSSDSDDDELPPSKGARKGRSAASENSKALAKRKRVRKFTPEERLAHRNFEKSRREAFKFNLGTLASLLPKVALTETKRLSKHVVTTESSRQHRIANARCRQALASTRKLLAERDNLLKELNYHLLNTGEQPRQPQVTATDFSLLFDFEKDALDIKSAAFAMGRPLNTDGEPKLTDDEPDYVPTPNELAILADVRNGRRSTATVGAGSHGPLSSVPEDTGIAHSSPMDAQPLMLPQPQPLMQHIVAPGGQADYAPYPDYSVHTGPHRAATGADSGLVSPLQPTTPPGPYTMSPMDSQQQRDSMMLDIQPMYSAVSEQSAWPDISSPQAGNEFFMPSMGHQQHPQQQQQHHQNHNLTQLPQSHIYQEPGDHNGQYHLHFRARHQSQNQGHHAPGGSGWKY
ncbi:hypothetical protein BROUX41_002577 [Berkeleyomyces rouxiae]|uniref:uncharacterized protein n=1 Tax=Berkeleyomyces rouxiae TaxID=2035830 RepID=UPI003B798407